MGDIMSIMMGLEDHDPIPAFATLGHFFCIFAKKKMKDQGAPCEHLFELVIPKKR